MEVLSNKFIGMYFICEQCGCLVGNIKENEIYNESDVYCPLCHYKNTLNYVKSYNGIAAKPLTEDKHV